MIDKDKVIQLAKEAGGSVMQPYDYGEKPDRMILLFDELETFAQAIYRQGLKDAAKVLEATIQTDEYSTAVIGSYADAIRSLKESTNG